MSGIELGYSYKLGSGWTRIGVLTRPRKRSGTVMTHTLSVVASVQISNKILSSSYLCPIPHSTLICACTKSLVTDQITSHTPS